MPTKVSLPLHLPRRRRPLGLGIDCRRPGFLGGVGLPPPCQGTAALRPGANQAPSAPAWTRQALREGLLAGLFTTLLTSAVWASPQMFRQSPATTWAQMISPVLATDQGPSPGALIDCP